ncbi:hypothetical protein PGB90_002744 [Kerria lacca]
MTEKLTEILKQQNQLLQLLIQQQQEFTSKPGDSSKQSIQFDSFNPKDEKFDCYLLRLENFFSIKKLTGTSDETDKAKVQILINSIGMKYIQLLRNSTAPDDPRKKKKKKYQELIDILKIQLAPRINIFSEKHQFLSRIQKQNESIAAYVSALQELALSCDWTCPQENCKKQFTSIILRAQFIRGLLDSDIGERLLQQPDQVNISFDKLVETTQSIELSKSDNKEIYKNNSSSNTDQVNKI